MLYESGAIEQAIELGISTGCSGVYFQNTFPTPNAPTDQLGNVIYDIHEKEYRDMISIMTKKYPKYPIYWPQVAPFEKPAKNRCKMPWYFLGVDADGRTGVCCLDPDCTQKSVLEYPPEEIMNEQKWLIIREKLIAGNADKNCLCKGCFLLNDEYGSDM